MGSIALPLGTSACSAPARLVPRTTAAPEHRARPATPPAPAAPHSATSIAPAATTDRPAPDDASGGPDRPPAPTSRWIALSPRVRVIRERSLVEFDAISVLREGFLEAYVCTPSTREHEALFVFDGAASEIHAALLVAGLSPGAPGGWRSPGDDDADAPPFIAIPPSGPEVSVEVVLPDGSTHPIASFARRSPLATGGVATRREQPPDRFVFAGSRFVPRRDGGERYLADGSGSLVGLVTFGDETIAAVEPIPDQASVFAPVFEADPDRMPAPGTEVRIRIGGGA